MSRQSLGVVWSFTFLGIAIGIAIYSSKLLHTSGQQTREVEGFSQNDSGGRDKPPTPEELRQRARVADAFESVLQRAPTPAEVRYFSGKKKTQLDDLEVRLRSTPEYRRLVMTQSNVPNQDIPFRLADRSAVFMIREAYKEIYHREPSPETLAFLKERFDAMGQDRDAFTRFLLTMHAAETGKQGAAWRHCPSRPDVSEHRLPKKRPPPRCLHQERSETLLSDLLRERQAGELTSKCAHSKRGDLVLRPEYKWTVPQKRPPVCVLPSKKQQCAVCPQTEQSALVGTLLGQHTAVGSMMPKFKYTEAGEEERSGRQ